MIYLKKGEAVRRIMDDGRLQVWGGPTLGCWLGIKRTIRQFKQSREEIITDLVTKGWQSTTAPGVGKNPNGD